MKAGPCSLFKLSIRPQWALNKYLLSQWWNPRTRSTARKVWKQGDLVLFFFLGSLALIFLHLIILLKAPFGHLPCFTSTSQGCHHKAGAIWLAQFTSLSLSLLFFLYPFPPPSLSLLATYVFNIFGEWVIFLNIHFLYVRGEKDWFRGSVSLEQMPLNIFLVSLPRHRFPTESHWCSGLY